MAKILLVEDDPSILLIYKKAFTFAGDELVTATNGTDGMARAKEKPDFILLDILMPSMDGLQVLHELKKSSSDLKDIPVIMLTNLSGDEYSNKALAEGAIMYLVKSQVTPPEVVKIVKSKLGGKV